MIHANAREIAITRPSRKVLLRGRIASLSHVFSRTQMRLDGAAGGGHHHHPPTWSAAMIRALLLLLVLAAPVRAQDVVGIEDCSKTQGADRKAGCLQSNVNYLHELIRKNEAAAQTRA